MFWPDVIALKEFYGSPLGQIACLAVRRRVRSFWPGVSGENVLGIGFATPYLLPFVEEAQGIFACMPAVQGVIHWPPGSANLSLLSDEAELPFPDNSMHHVLAVHALENSEHARQMMSEIWRVLTPAGRLLVIVPNRRGIWARSPQSPFAYGQPFTAPQLRQLLSEHSLTPLSSSSALFFPPSQRRYILRSARFWEEFGNRFFSSFGGILLMEAEKQIYATATQKALRRVRKSYVSATQPAVT
jgi:SAM-dependent methyltransferase